MKHLIIFYCLSCSCLAGEILPDPFEPPSTWAKEIIIGTEFGQSPDFVIQYKESPTISIQNNGETEQQKKIIKEVIHEINKVLSKTKIKLILQKDNQPANIVIERIDEEKKGLKGTAYCTWEYTGEIVYSVVGFDYEIKNENLFRHLAYEEIVQSLGILKDSWQYPDSIFFQGYSENTLSDYDKYLLNFFYNKLKPGTKKEKAFQIIDENFSP